VEEVGVAEDVIAEAAPAASVYDRVAERLDALVPVFDLDASRTAIARTYEALCRESLAVPAGHRPLHPSRLNADGTPFQLSLTLDGSSPALQFLTEVGSLAATNAERLAAARDAIDELAQLFGAESSLPRVRALLDEAAPPDDRDLLADEAGALWLGAAFAPGGRTGLKVYVNAKWGEEGARRARLATFAAGVGVEAEWRAVEALTRGDLEPLGVSLSVIAGSQPTARIYLSGYGRRFADYEALARECAGAGFDDCLRSYGKTLLAENYDRPTRSAVWSFGTSGGSLSDVKLELCGHCAFDNDLQARTRCVACLRQLDISSEQYLAVVGLLSGGLERRRDAILHAYVGVGLKQHKRYATFYFNPAAGWR